jgi:leader peptidase (prepilin peptidase)/N-methyltransferase
VLTTVIVAAVCLAAAWIDLRTHRIPNALTLPAIVIGVIMAGLSGWKPLMLRVLTVAIVLCTAIVLHVTGVWGGGDGKLVAAVAALKGLPFVVESAAAAFLIGGVAALWILVRKRVTGAPPGVSHIPFGPLIAAGVAVTLVSEALGFRLILPAGFPYR